MRLKRNPQWPVEYRETIIPERKGSGSDDRDAAGKGVRERKKGGRGWGENERGREGATTNAGINPR